VPLKSFATAPGNHRRGFPGVWQLRESTTVADDLLPYPLTPKTVHLCVDMQRIFSAEGPWATPWMERVLPGVAELAGRYPERAVFTRFITPNRADDMPGMWQRYYGRWREATREKLDPGLLDLLPPLASLCPPATIIDKLAIQVSQSLN
jgi:nicotinamidase-related amidase